MPACAEVLEWVDKKLMMMATSQDESEQQSSAKMNLADLTSILGRSLLALLLELELNRVCVDWSCGSKEWGWMSLHPTASSELRVRRTKS